MKLISLYIENFGRLSGYSHTFSDGLQIIFRPNGWGKTTLAVFIKAMLYGLPASRSKDLEENERRRYQPWQGGTYGGSLCFSVGEKSYRVERTFAQRESDDTFALYDYETSQPSRDFSSELGCELFGIDADGYERSTYLSQRPHSKDNYETIQAKLTDLDDLPDLSGAMEKLEKRRKFYASVGTRGAIPDLEREIRSTERELEAGQECLRNSAQTQHALQEETGKLTGLRALSESLHDQMQHSIEHTQRESVAEQERVLRAALSDAESLCGGLRDGFGEQVPTADQIERMQKLHRSLLEREQTVMQLGEQARKIRFSAARRRFGLRLLLWCATVVSGIAAVLLALFVHPAAGAIFAAGALVLALSAILIRVPTRELPEISARIAEYAEGIHEDRSELDTFLRCTAPLGSAMPEPGERLSAMYEKLSLLNRACTNRDRAESALSEFRRTHLLPQEDSGPAVDLEEVRRKINSNQADMDATANRIAKLRATLEQELAAIEQDTAKRQHLAHLKEEHAAYTQSLAVIRKTEELLGEAGKRLTTRYRVGVERNFDRYLTLLADEKHAFAEELRVSPSFEVSAVSRGAVRQKVQFSRGTQDLIGFCLACALTDSLFTQEQPFLILDDPFVNLDDDTLECAKSLLQELGKHRQIICFICHSSRL